MYSAPTPSSHVPYYSHQPSYAVQMPMTSSRPVPPPDLCVRQKQKNSSDKKSLKEVLLYVGGFLIFVGLFAAIAAFLNRDTSFPLELEGYVVDSFTGSGISAHVSITAPNGAFTTETQPGNGYFFFKPITSGKSTITITSDDYPDHVKNLKLDRVEESHRFNLDANYRLRAVAVDAMTRQTIPSATVSIKKDGTVVQAGMSSLYGVYAFSPLSPSLYYVTIEKPGYATLVYPIQITGKLDFSLEQSYTISPVLDANTYRVVLHWSSNSHDLDTFLVTPWHCVATHDDYCEKEGTQVHHSGDLTAHGPEIITIINPHFADHADKYEVQVQLLGYDTFINTNAIIFIYDSTGLSQTLEVSSVGNLDSGLRYWCVGYFGNSGFVVTNELCLPS
ncbi:hypothetical protein RCL1_005939 [Eukaryota sp. TZLM3-RCL]